MIIQSGAKYQFWVTSIPLKNTLLFYKGGFIACVGVSLKCKSVVCESRGWRNLRCIQCVEYVSCSNNGTN